MQNWLLGAWSRRLMQVLGAHHGTRGTGGAPATALAAAHPQEIVLDVDAADAKGLLRVVAQYIARAHALDVDPVERALERREDAGSTALGFGLAIPHARIDGIAHALTLFLRTRRPIPFGAPDGQPTSNFFVIMVPATGD